MTQKQIRWISVWVLFVLTVLCDSSLASVNSMTEQAVWGHSVGSFLAAAIISLASLDKGSGKKA